MLSEKAIKHIFEATDEEKLEKYPINHKLIEKCVSEGWIFFPVAEEFFEAYGGWFMPNSIEIQAFVPDYKSFSDNLFHWMKIMNVQLFPFGSNSISFYLMSEKGAIYVTDEQAHSMLKLGDTVADGFNSVIWFDHEKPEGYISERTTFWRPWSDFPPPFVHEIFVTKSVDLQTEGHWETVYPLKNGLSKI